MSVQTQKISVYSLVPGMFVYKLDRPWADTSYPLEGFHIRNNDEIRKLKLICRHVYIDVNKTSQQIQKKLLGQQQKENQTKSKASKPIRLARQKHYTTVIPFKKALKQAKKQHRKLHQGITELFEEYQVIQVLEVEKIKPVIRKTVDTIIDNPDAMMWLARTQNYDNYSYNFVLKQTVWALACGRQLGMSRPDLEKMALASILTAVGKNKIPKSVLEREQQLDAKAFAIYKKHVEYSVQIVGKMKSVAPEVVRIIQNYCEFYDGSGYPHKRKGKEIPIASQLLSISQFYESLTAPRQLEQAISPNDAIEQLNRQKERKFSAAVVELFVQAIGIYPPGTLVRLSNNAIAVITENKNNNFRLKPDVIVLRDANNKKPQQKICLKLADEKHSLTIMESLALGSCQITLDEIHESLFEKQTGFIKKLMNW